MNKKGLIAKALSFLPRSKRLEGILLVMATLVTSILEALGISLILPILTLTLDGNLDQLHFNFEIFFDKITVFGDISLIYKIFIVLISIYIIKNIYLLFYYYWQNKYSLNIYKTTSTKLYELYLNCKMSFHFEKNSSELIRNVLVECKNYSAVINTLIKLISESAILISIIFMLMILRPIETATSAIIISFFTLILYYITNKRVENWGKIRQDTTGLALKNLQQGLQAIKDIKLKNCQSFFKDNYLFQINKFVKSAYKHNTMMELPKIWLELVFIIIFPIVIIYSSIGDNSFELKKILPTLGLFVAAIFKLLPSIYRIFGSFQTISFNKAAIEKLYEEFQSADLNNQNFSQELNNRFKFKEEINIKNVFYKYPSTHKNLLENFSLKIKKNETIGIIGKSGVGKSTLINLIIGLLNPDKGNIQVDGKDIQNDIKSWYNSIGYIPAACYLLDDTIRNNIAFGVKEQNIDDEMIKKAAKDAQIYDYINSLDHKFDTIIGERGIKLSDGQKQRIGIARELYRNNEILVLDEATSTLDIKTEDEILDTLSNLKKSKTIMIISHRNNTIKICDRVISLTADPFLNYH